MAQLKPFLTLVCAIVILQGCQPKATDVSKPPDTLLSEMETKQAQSTTPAEAPEANNDMYMGIQPVSAERLYELMPELKGKPTILTFHSQFCLDCKKMKPVIDASAKKFPAVFQKTIEIQEDHDRYKGVLQAFKPVTVPVFLFIDSHGKTINILYNTQPQALIEKNLATINRS